MSPLGEGFSDTVNVPLISPPPPSPVKGSLPGSDMVVRMRKVMAIPRSWYVRFSGLTW